MNKIVSIIVPVYNAEKYLKASLQSIIDQSFHGLEIIVIDDASIDKSKDIIAQFSKLDKRIKMILKPLNSGASNTRNQGLQTATGDYLVFHDSDDLMYPEKIEHCVNLLENKSGYSGVFSTADYIDESGTQMGVSTSVPDYITSNPYFVRNIERSYLATWSLFAHSSLLKDTFFDETITNGSEDFDLIFRLFYKRRKFLYEPRPLMSYRQIGSSLSRKNPFAFNKYIYNKYKDKDILKLYDNAGYNKAMSFFAMAKVCVWREAWTEALKYAQSARAGKNVFPQEENDLLFITATCNYYNDLLNDCLKDLENIKGSQYSAEVHNNMGVCLAKMGKSDPAQASIQKALEIFPDFYDANNNISALKMDVPVNCLKYTRFPIRRSYIRMSSEDYKKAASPAGDIKS